jgi:ABC-2 type transport system ATP-binding protein
MACRPRHSLGDNDGGGEWDQLPIFEHGPSDMDIALDSDRYAKLPDYGTEYASTDENPDVQMGNRLDENHDGWLNQRLACESRQGGGHRIEPSEEFAAMSPPDERQSVSPTSRMTRSASLFRAVASAIVVRDLRKTYGDVRAVDGVSFEVRGGEFFGILGPNGAGKTTTLEIIEGLRQADSGEVRVFDMLPWPRNPRLLPRIGVQLQSSSFFERLTIREQIRTFASLYGLAPSRADNMLDVVGLSDKADTRVERLSGGQAQRLSIACALVHEPELLFLDEPTAALDPQGRRNLWDLLRGINTQGRTIVLTTHHLDEAETLCDRVAIMNDGKILELGPPAVLVRGLDAPTRISIESGLLPIDEVRNLFHGSTVFDDGVSLTIATKEPGPVLAALAERSALRALSVRGATLEDVYLSLTGREYRA